MSRLRTWALALIFSVSCAGSIQITRIHTIKLTKVSGGIGGGKIATSENATIYEDRTLKIEFDKIIDTQVEFVLHNKTNSPLTVLWDQSSYIDPTGQSHKAIHKGTRLLERNEATVPTVIPPRSFLSDLIAPASYTYWSQGVPGYTKSKWKTTKLIDEGTAKGKTIGVFLSMRTGQIANEYLFTFAVETVTTETRRRQTWY